jgi:hypothetical protein
MAIHIRRQCSGIVPMTKSLRQLQEILDLRVLRDVDGMFRLTATRRHDYGQPFWFSDCRFSSPEDAMRSPDLFGPRGPSC